MEFLVELKRGDTLDLEKHILPWCKAKPQEEEVDVNDPIQ